MSTIQMLSMSPTQEIVDLLRDEAYVTLSSKIVNQALERVGVEKYETEGTRPPFGIFGGPKRRETFSRKMQSLERTEGALHTHLSSIGALREIIEPTLREALDNYLKEAAPDCQRSGEIVGAINAWENQLVPLFEQLWAFARDLRDACLAIEPALADQHAGISVEQRLSLLAELRISAQRMDRSVQALLTAEEEVAAVAGEFFAEVKLNSPPASDWRGWSDGLAQLTDAELVASIRTAEAQARTMISGDLRYLREGAAAAREVTQAVAGRYRDAYWAELRYYAEQHYVQERDLEDTLRELTERYVVGRLRKRQEQLENSRDPYRHER